MTGLSRPPRIEEYRSKDPPSSSFSREQVAYIESIQAFLDGRDLNRVRGIERFGMNLEFNTLIAVEIPGLRTGPDSLVMYVKRFGDDSYIEMSHRFLDLALDGSYGRDVRQYIMRPYRITLPTGDRYYPFAVGTDAETWRRRFRRAAETLKTATAEFDRGLFVVTLENSSLGEIYTFGTLTIDVADPADLDDW